MYPIDSTRTLAYSQAPRTFTYIFFWDMILYDMLAATERYIVPGTAPTIYFLFPPVLQDRQQYRSAKQQYSCTTCTMWYGVVVVVYNSQITQRSATLPRRIALDFALGFVPPAST
jgi:hypothetical protein